MRIPRIYKRDDDFNESNKITTIDIESQQLDPVVYSPDVDFDDDKSVKKYIKSMKTMIRQSREYRSLMSFLKNKCEMNGCFFFPKIKKYRDSKVTIEIHHTGFVLEDLIKIILTKRYKENEDYDFQSVAEELMLEHYRGHIGLTALSSTMHELIHEDDSGLFIPLHQVDFGNMNIFYDIYKEYIDKDTIKKFEQYKVLSDVVDNIESILPNYLDVHYIYYKKEGIEVPDMNKILEIIDLQDN